MTVAFTASYQNIPVLSNLVAVTFPPPFLPEIDEVSLDFVPVICEATSNPGLRRWMANAIGPARAFFRALR